MTTGAERTALYRLRKKGLAPPPDYVLRGRRLTPLERNRKHLYGVSPDDYESILNKQGNMCAICRVNNDGENWNVDHDHDSGGVRGVLCRSCNRTVGFIEKNLHLLEKIMAYITK